MLRFLPLALALASACGQDASGAPDAGGPSGAGPDADGPVAALLVTGQLTVDNRGNDVTGADKRVVASVRVSRDGAPIDNALIRLNPPGAVQTYLTGEADDPSLYTGSYTGYNNDTVRIEITAGDARIDELVLLGQAMFAIRTPAPGATVAAGVALSVTWGRDGAAADLLRVTTTAGYDSGPLADAAAHTVPGDALNAGPLELRVFRARRNPLARGAEGSALAFGVASTIALIVE